MYISIWTRRMKVANLLSILIISVIVIESDGTFLGDIFMPVKHTWNEWKSKFNHVDQNVHALYSPYVFKAISFKLQNMAKIIDDPNFKKDRPTVIYIHGWLSNGELEESVMAIRSAYRKRNDHNFIAIDWSTYSHWHIPVPYVASMAKLKEICIVIAQQLDIIRRNGYENFYLVGHSLGGQATGLIGRTLKELSKGEFMVSKIYALDPAGPGYEFDMALNIDGFDCISKNDAKYVQIIHTNGGQLGIANSVGHADFYPNGGKKQPGCSNKHCNHAFAWIFYQESVREKHQLVAVKCDSYENFTLGNCTKGEVSSMGFSDNHKPVGKFFLRTHPSKYGSALGNDGIVNEQFVIVDQHGNKETRDNLRIMSVDAKKDAIEI